MVYIFYVLILIILKKKLNKASLMEIGFMMKAIYISETILL